MNNRIIFFYEVFTCIACSAVSFISGMRYESMHTKYNLRAIWVDGARSMAERVSKSPDCAPHVPEIEEVDIE